MYLFYVLIIFYKLISPFPTRDNRIKECFIAKDYYYFVQFVTYSFVYLITVFHQLAYRRFIQPRYLSSFHIIVCKYLIIIHTLDFVIPV